MKLRLAECRRGHGPRWRPLLKGLCGLTSPSKPVRDGRARVHQRQWHDLRHAFASFCAAQGIPMRTIQEWIGHEDFATLRIYMHYAPSGFEVDLLNRAIEQEKAGGVGAPQIAPNLKPGGRG